ncbi:hypothetical protein WJX82_004139 [Trebouxia sp. C0006]
MDQDQMAEVQTAFTSDVQQLQLTFGTQDVVRALRLLSETFLSYAEDLPLFDPLVVEQTGKYCLELLHLILKPGVLQQSDCGSMLSLVWPSVRQCLRVAVLTIQGLASLVVEASNEHCCSQAQLAQAIFQFLWRWRPLDVNSWDGCLVATVHQLTVSIAERGPGCLSELPCLALCQVLACSHTAALWLKTMLAHPSAAGTKGLKKTFGAFSTCFQHCAPALLLGCCDLLKPESNQPVAVRMEGLLTMGRAIDHFLNSPSSSDEAQLQLWPEEGVHLLLFTCTKDPSVRIRRAAMSLLTSVVSKQQSAQEEAIVRALVLKCRDKDSRVQSQAYEMLVQLPSEAVCHASQYLQALQLPWHSSVVHHAYSSALAACHQHQ